MTHTNHATSSKMYTFLEKPGSPYRSDSYMHTCALLDSREVVICIYVRAAPGAKTSLSTLRLSLTMLWLILSVISFTIPLPQRGVPQIQKRLFDPVGGESQGCMSHRSQVTAQSGGHFKGWLGPQTVRIFGSQGDRPKQFFRKLQT